MRLRQHHFWPLVPGRMLLAIGVGLLFDPFTDDLPRYLVPGVVVALGLLVILAGYLRTAGGQGGGAT